MTEQGWLPAYPGIKYNWAEEATSFDCPCGAKDIIISESGVTVTCFCGRVYRLRHYVEVAMTTDRSDDNAAKG